MFLKKNKKGKKKEFKPLTDKEIKKRLEKIRKMDPEEIMPGRHGGCDVIM